MIKMECFGIPFFLALPPLTSPPAPWGEGTCFTKSLHSNPDLTPRPLSHWERGACFIKNKKPPLKPRPHPRPLSHWERGACFTKNKKPSPKPRPHPRPLSHWERGACFIKNKKPHSNPQKSSTSTTPQASPPHEMRPLGRISGGVGGLVPPQKKTHFKNADGMTRQF